MPRCPMSDLTPSTSADSLLSRIQRRTPARILVGKAGLSYRTATLLELRLDHAAALDAVRRELDLARDFGDDFLAARRLFLVQTLATDKETYLRRPDLG